MKQAYQHIEPGTTYYDFIKDQISELVNTWNSTHAKQSDLQTIADACKTIFKYHHWIKVEDIKGTFELGLMGEYGENKGLNNETIFTWFKTASARAKKHNMDTNPEYECKPTFIPEDQRRETRLSLIQTFMNFHDEYCKTKVYNSKIDHYIPAFFRWFKKLGLVSLSDDQEDEMFKDESLKLQDMRSFLSQGKKHKRQETQKSLFIEIFMGVCDQDYGIETQLKSIKL